MAWWTGQSRSEMGSPASRSAVTTLTGRLRSVIERSPKMSLTALRTRSRPTETPSDDRLGSSSTLLWRPDPLELPPDLAGIHPQTHQRPDESAEAAPGHEVDGVPRPFQGLDHADVREALGSPGT